MASGRATAGERGADAARNRWSRVEALQRDRAFQEAYQVALKQWMAGLPAVFPAGTYKLRGKPGVVIQE